MNEGDFRTGIRKAWEYAKAIGIDGEFSTPVSLVSSDEFKRIATDSDSSYEQIYLLGLKGVDYNILLADYSYLQFSFGSATDVRYAYYANPFLGSSREAIVRVAEMHEYVEEGIIELDEFLHSISEIRKSKHPPLVRYEYASEQYIQLVHPSSHLHLGFHSDSRWPVRRVLTPKAFGLLIMKLFYGEFWRAAPPLIVQQEERSLDHELSIAKNDCRLLSQEEFSADEELQFFWG